MIIDHIGLAVNDYAQSKIFFTQALAPLGIALIKEVEGRAGFGKNGKAEFWFGAHTPVQNPMRIAFAAENRAQVDGFHEAALKAGARDKGTPSVRAHYHPHYWRLCHRPGWAQHRGGLSSAGTLTIHPGRGNF